MKLPRIKCLYDAVGPNPWVVRLALGAKGIDLASITKVLKNVDGVPENRHCSKIALNPAGTTPFMELDDGTVLAESVAMVHYADAAVPVGPVFMGSGAVEQAEVLMWQRRIELNIVGPFQRQYQNGEGSPYFGQHVPWVEASKPSVPGLRAQVVESLRWLDATMGAQGDRDFIAGKSCTVSDLQLYTTLEFMSNPKVNAATLTESFDPRTTVVPSLPWLSAWLERMQQWEQDVGPHLRAPVCA